MKKIIKIIFTILGILLLGIVLALAGFILYVRFKVPPDANSFAVSREKGMSYEQIDAISRDLVAQMTIKEKLVQMSGDIGALSAAEALVHFFVFGKIPLIYSGRNDRLEIPPFAFTDGPRGVVVTEATAFPVAIARAASWDRDLEYRIGDTIGKEARAAGANYFGGVCINLLRHPAWGRAQESYGEDPWLTGEMGISLIDGVQKHNVMACAKHFALNSIEISRFKVDVRVDERTLREVYLPHFHKAVESGVASIMSAYNKVRGEYCGHSRYLLSDILRGDWGFRGFVTSDWMQGVRDPQKGVLAGMDVEMPFQIIYGDTLESLLQSGAVTMEVIDEIVQRIVRTKLYFTTRKDEREYKRDLLACEEHAKLALEAAEKSMVLLKNDKGVLPLSKTTIGSLAVIGKLATADNTGDRGSSCTHPPYVVTPLEGIAALLGKNVTVTHTDGTDMEAARKAARQADRVVCIVGYGTGDEGEYIPEMAGSADSAGWGRSGDRPNLSLKSHDIELIKTVAHENPDCIAVLIGGSAIMMEEWKELVPAIIMGWYPGMEGGSALAQILFGEVNPSGKLPFTIPTDASHLPFFHADIDSIEYGYYHGYTLFDKNGVSPAFPFGYGLSYTSYKYTDLGISQQRIGKNDTLTASVQVENTGAMAGEEVVQLYVGFKKSAVDRPIKLLRGFAKVALAPGEKKRVVIRVPVGELAWYNPETSAWQIDSMPYEVYVGRSSRNIDLLEGVFWVED